MSHADSASYDSVDGGYANKHAKPAPDASTNDGACPAQVTKYRVYPETDFANFFGQPPRAVRFQ